MSEAEWKTYRGEGGALHRLMQPLGEVYADQVRNGRLVEVIEALAPEAVPEKPKPRRKAPATNEEG